MFAEEIVENVLPKKWIIAGVITVILGIFVLNAFGVVGPTERGVMVTLGVASEDVLTPGLKLKAPFLQQIKKYDLTPIQYKSSFNSVSDAAVTSDKQSILVNFELFWKYDEEKLYTVATRYSTKESLYQPISTSLKGIIKDIVGKLSINEIIADQGGLTRQVKEILVADTAYLPIIIDKFTITNLDWSEEYDRQIEQTALLAQQVEQAKQQALIVEAEAQKQVKEAEAKLQAEKLNAEAEIAKAISQIIISQLAKCGTNIFAIQKPTIICDTLNGDIEGTYELMKAWDFRITAGGVVGLNADSLENMTQVIVEDVLLNIKEKQLEHGFSGLNERVDLCIYFDGNTISVSSISEQGEE